MTGIAANHDARENRGTANDHQLGALIVVLARRGRQRVRLGRHIRHRSVCDSIVGPDGAGVATGACVATADGTGAANAAFCARSGATNSVAAQSAKRMGRQVRERAVM